MKLDLCAISLFCLSLYVGGCAASQTNLEKNTPGALQKKFHEMTLNEWQRSRESAHIDFVSDNAPAIRSYLRMFSAIQQDDQREDLIPITGGFASLGKEPSERLPRIFFYDNHKKPTREYISLDSGIPENFDLDVLRISDSGQKIAVLYKNLESKFLCIFSRRGEKPACMEGNSIYDIAWPHSESALLATTFERDKDAWSVASVRVADLSLTKLHSEILHDGFLLIQRSPSEISVVRKRGLHSEPLTFTNKDLASPLLGAFHNSSSSTADRCKDSAFPSYQSYDGTRIPYSMARKSTPSLRGILIRFYGAYGTTLREKPSPYLQPFLDSGFEIATLGIRGGGDCGSSWEDSGSGLNRYKSIEDLESGIDYLHKQYPDIPLFLMTRSAGGIAAAIALHEKAGLLKGAILEAPFVSLSAWARSKDFSREVHVWGDPATPEGKSNINLLEHRMKQIKLPVYIWLGAKDSIVPSDWTREWIDRNLPQAVVAIDPLADHEGPVDTAQTAEKYGEEFAFLTALTE